MNASELSGELAGVQAGVEAKLKSLGNLNNLNVSVEAHTEISNAIATHNRRLGAVFAAKQAVDVLLADGYPQLPAEIASAEIIAEIKVAIASVAASAGLFESSPPSSPSPEAQTAEVSFEAKDDSASRPGLRRR
jgi:hypothetical protein